MKSIVCLLFLFTIFKGGGYKGRFIVKASYAINGIAQPSFEKILGNLPIMLRSNACHLRGLSPKQLIERGEEQKNPNIIQSCLFTFFADYVCY